MSESYPKSNPWPFVLLGILLFGLALLPPTQSPMALREICIEWMATESGRAIGLEREIAASRVVVGHNPWEQQERSLVEESEIPIAELTTVDISPAPTWNVTKSVAKVTDSVVGDDLEEPHDSILAAVVQETASSRYVWQPPKNWVPTLIQPFADEPQRVLDASTEPLVAVPIAEPVAKLDGHRPRRRPRVKPDLSLSVNHHVEIAKSAPELEPDDLEGTPKEPPVIVESETHLPEPQSTASSHPTRQISQRLEQLFELGSSQPRLARWADQLRGRISKFHAQPATGSPQQRQEIEQLAALATYQVDTRRWNSIEKETYWRIRHAIERRTDVWRPLLEVAGDEAEHADRVNAKVIETARRFAKQLRSDPSTSSWSSYLKLEQFSNGEAPHEAAERTLARLRNSHLASPQRDFLSRPVFNELESDLRAAISAGVKTNQIINVLEEYEDRSFSRTAQTAVATLQRFGTGPHLDRYVPAIRAIDTHYRNANIRVAVSEELINGSIPAINQYAEQVRDTILGASVRGRNSTHTNLSVDLLPDENAIRIGLLAQGMVNSDTASRKGPVVFFNQGESRFAAGKELIVRPDGIHLSETETRASTGSRVVGLKTDFDGFPLLGWLARNVARQQHDEQRPFLRAEVIDRVRKSATKKLDVEVQRRLANVENRVQSKVVQPLRKLKLDPRAMELRTTNDRAILRARLAGPLQLAANTPRPQARIDSKMSIQVHQSAANNLVQRLELQGRRMTLGELASELGARFGIQMEIAEKRRATIVQFSDERPLDFEFQDGRIQIAIHFAELDNGHDRWTNFSVRGFYRTDIQKMDVELIRDGSIELITESLRLRDQIALRSIFTKVFSSNQRLELLRHAIQEQPMLRSLAMTQFTIRDGWIAVSVGEVAPSSIASEKKTTVR